MSPSFFNPEEVVTVLKYIKQLLQDPELNVKEEEIGVISPYRRQCQKIRLKLGDSSDVMVGTTEEFQGQERRVIILTTVRSNPDFIQQDQLVQIGFLKNRKRFRFISFVVIITILLIIKVQRCHHQSPGPPHRDRQPEHPVPGNDILTPGRVL